MECPHCKFRLPDGYASKDGSCPICNQQLPVPIRKNIYNCPYCKIFLPTDYVENGGNLCPSCRKQFVIKKKARR